MAIEHLVDADTRLAYQITERLTGARTMGRMSDTRLSGGYCGENPEQMGDGTLEQRICGDVPCQVPVNTEFDAA